MLVSVHTRTRAETARKAEAEALADAGAQSYLGFHLQRVNGMLSSEPGPQAPHRASPKPTARLDAAWKELAGDVPVEWAIDHYEEIAAAARVRIDITAHATMAVAEHVVEDDDTTDLARVLVGRLAELRRLGERDREPPADPRRPVRRARPDGQAGPARAPVAHVGLAAARST